MRVLYCSYEVAPFFKKGGLGDVAGSLPKALSKLGVDIRVVMPGYESVLRGLGTLERLGNSGKSGRSGRGERKKSFLLEFDGKEEKVTVWESNLPGSKVVIYFLENKKYLAELKSKAEALEQFAFFSKAITQFINFQFDVIHLNDWHTALVPLLFKLVTRGQTPVTLLTVHNFGHQGKAPLSLLTKLGIRAEWSPVLAWDAADNDLEILMEGIIHADCVNTVSPTYAREVLDSKLWGKLSEVLKGKEARVEGILNGIDYSVWNPQTDRLINFQFAPPKRSSSRKAIFNFQKGKGANKLALQKELGLEQDEKIPLLAFIGRLASKQKGLEILYRALLELLPKRGFQFVLLGKGSKKWEKRFKDLERRVKSTGDRRSSLPISATPIRVVIRFDERLAHRIYAGADFILMPSQFEPCGLVQQIGMRYGTLPIVRKTGGLADTVKDGVNGFVFEEYSSSALTKSVKLALNTFKVRPPAGGSRFEEMVERGMGEDFSWKKSAKEYLKLYQKALEIRKES